MNRIDEFVQKKGFKNAKEFYSLVAKVDLSDPVKMKRFMEWRDLDGTKEGLLKVNDPIYTKDQVIKLLREFKWHCQDIAEVNQLDEETREIVCDVDEEKWLKERKL